MRTLSALERDPHPARHGAVALLGVSAAYTAILAAFLSYDCPAAAESVRRLPVDRQYAAQIWYQATLFFAATALTAAALVLVARLARHDLAYPVAFGRIALATAVPFARTTMLVEAVIAVLVASGVLQPLPTLQWLSGGGRGSLRSTRRSALPGWRHSSSLRSEQAESGPGG
jgi:hypothetical protein